MLAPGLLRPIAYHSRKATSSSHNLDLVFSHYCTRRGHLTPCALLKLCLLRTVCLDRLTLDTKDVQPWGDATVDQVLEYAALSAKWENNDAIDRAITQAVGDRSRLTGNAVERIVPFNPVDKKTTAVFTTPEGRRLHATKGAPQVPF